MDGAALRLTEVIVAPEEAINIPEAQQVEEYVPSQTYDKVRHMSLCAFAKKKNPLKQFPDEEPGAIEVPREGEEGGEEFGGDETMLPEEEPMAGVSVVSAGTPSVGDKTPLRTPGEEMAIPPSVQPEVKRGQKKRLRIDASTVISAAYARLLVFI